MITDRLRWTVIEANTNIILTRDLIVKNPQAGINLSAPAQIQFTVPQGEDEASAAGITWHSWGQWVIVDIEIDYVRQIFCAAIVTSTKIDPASGDMAIEAEGLLSYAKGIPWLDNFNPIAVDPFEIVQRVWAYLQSFSNANLGVVVQPASSGTQMLPGYGYDGSTLTFNFYAVFIRAVDFNDSSDYITALARDIPFDMIEGAHWNEDRTEVTKTLTLGYPQGGLQQDHLTFRLGENVLSATKADELDIQPVSDVIIRAWTPGKVFSSELSNANPVRFRRTIMEEDANIESDERAAAWAKRKLTRRNIPISFSKIVIDPNHPNGPLGSFNIGDSIYVEAQNYPWVGDIIGWHRVLGIAYDETKGLCELQLKVDGAFNYDPIEYDPNYDSQPVSDPNLLSNGYFAQNLGGWTASKGQWFRDPDTVYGNDFATTSGSVRIDCDDIGERFESQRVTIKSGDSLRLQCVVKYEDVVSTAGVSGFQLLGITSNNGDLTVGETFTIGEVIHPDGTQGWTPLEMLNWVVPAGVNELALIFNVTSAVTAGTAWWTYARIVPASTPDIPTIEQT